MMSVHRHFENQWQVVKAAASGSAVLAREASYERFLQLGLPSTRHEEWRYTSLAPLSDIEWATTTVPQAVSSAAIVEKAGLPLGHRFVFVNGRFMPALSSLQALPPDVVVAPLSASMAMATEPLQDDGRALTALNSALFEDGATIVVPRNTKVELPIELLFVTASTAPFMAHPRVVLVAEENSQVALLETFVSLGQTPYFNNVVTSVSVGPNAAVRHYRLQDEGAQAIHMGLVQATVLNDSRFLSHGVSVGASVGRYEVRVKLAAPGAQATLQGLYLGQGKQLLDNHTVVEHAEPHGTSQEIFKGILADQSHGVFNGKVIVRENAVQTDSSQLNQNLLLSEKALADTRPQLEIFADDVKCKHGATIGRMDDKALFYLRSRGIPRETAQNILTYAFASEMVSLIALEPYKARIQALVKARLPDGMALGALA